MFLKNKNIIFKIKRSKVTDYAALIIHTFLSAPACTDMVVSSKELEHDVTTNAMAKEPQRLKTLASFLKST